MLVLRRRRLLAGVLGVAALGACTVGSTPVQPAYAAIPLYAEGIVLDEDGLPRLVRVGAQADHDAAQLARQGRWLEQGSVPGPERYAAMAEQALRDLETLLLPNGAVLAGANPAWHYVWPRDASFAVAALARTGHPDDALAVLGYLQEMQRLHSTDGVFEARYLPDGTGAVPDDRGLQLDGDGWVLWAVAEWHAAAPAGPERDSAVAALRPLVAGSVAAIRSHVDAGTGLPGLFPDYWEVRETVPTLGTLAPLLAGLRAAAPVLDALDLPGTTELEQTLQRGVDAFGPTYPRRLGGTAQDTAVAFLMPPFAPLDDEVRLAWASAARAMGRPAGGLAPGTAWKKDGISWTPTTAVFALTAAASGDVAGATERLDWLDQHRTVRGALPEKVLWDGSPSAVAPLGWTASLVLLTLDELDRLSRAQPPSAG